MSPRKALVEAGETLTIQVRVLFVPGGCLVEEEHVDYIEVHLGAEVFDEQRGVAYPLETPKDGANYTVKILPVVGFSDLGRLQVWWCVGDQG